MSLWIFLLAPLVGVLLALFGAGGGMVTVPLLTYGLGLPLKQAIAMALWIVALVSLVSLLQQRAWRVLQPRLLMFFGFGGALGGALGARLGVAAPEWLQQLLFGLLICGVALWMRHGRLTPVSAPARPCRCVLALTCGVALGSLTGLLGVGGGFLMVPALVALGLSHLRTAVAHSLVLIVVNAIVAGWIYLWEVPVALHLIGWVAGLAAVGSVAGGLIVSRLPAKQMQSAFSIGLLVLGLGMLLELALNQDECRWPAHQCGR